ncbi:flavin oxidoreductase [Idiomarina tyrosinivorans]|uniref:Flavin oxidoreductase n=1 Tax=Idiomarina tyrosinivorans TaxID=1445662 RepID=A0A432ZJP2_9GAMM|nr:flavin reductase family protein [Idiomarina tyrosinivorans]RUO78186.1 flavin oxidoreductase [Idiomarina tyrosinivorans]
MKQFSLNDLARMEKPQRVHFVNALSGFKSANIIGTADRKQNTNAAIVSSVFHLGSNPPLLGMILRPHSVARHTLENIDETGVYTVNHVGESFYQQAHQTSARYDRTQSEFDACGLTAGYVDGFHAPYVVESPLQVGMKLVEITPIQHNGTELVIGEVEWVRVAESCVKDDGFLDLAANNTVAVSGLDSYYRTERLARLSYAKPDQPLTELDLDGKKR